MKKIIKSIKFSFLALFITIIGLSASVEEKNIDNTNINKTVNLSTMAMKIEQSEWDKLYTPLNTYSGDLTGYVYNCPLCTGKLACMSSLDLSGGRTTYNDESYGDLRIVASSSNLPCGSVVSFESDRVSSEMIYAIVLDRGVIGTSLDLLVANLDDAYTTVGRSEITYNVLRNGWGTEE